MSFDLQWDHQFCLACDKQTDGATYCSESCRLADFEKTASTPSSGASSPALTGPAFPWSLGAPTTYSSSSNGKFYLSPAYDFSNAAPYGSTPAGAFYAPNARQHAQQQRRAERQLSQAASLAPPARVLSPSSSHSSLSSVRSSSSASAAAAETSTLSDKARSELRAYAISFEQVRLQRRRSY